MKEFENTGEIMYTKNLSRLLLNAGLSASLILVAAFSGCSTKNQLGGTDSLADSITVTASPSSISTSVTTIVEATVFANGVVISDEPVTFIVSPASAGTVSPAVDTSDAQGIAATVFSPSGSGQVTITATANNGTVSATTVILVDEDEASAGNGFVWVTVSPDTIRTGQAGAANIRIEVRDSLQQIPALNTEVVVQVGENFTDNDSDGYYTPGADQLTDFNSNGWWDPVGTFDSLGYTDASGIVNVAFTGQSDVARVVSVRATIRNAALSGFDKAYVYFEPYDPSAGAVGVTSDVNQLIADGSSQATISIDVRDVDGQSAPAGTEVRLTAGEKFQDNNNDGQYTAGIDQVLVDANNNGLWDALGTITSPVYTDASGIATATYTAGTEPWDVYIKAKVIDQVITASRELMLSVSAAVELHTIFLSSDSMHLSVIQTGGIQTSRLHATAYDAWGNAVPAGYPIAFTIVNGPGGGEHLYNNATGYGPYNTLTDENGQAEVAITSGTISGTIRVRAVSGTVLSNATQILVSAGPPAYITVAADTCNSPSWNRVNDEMPIVAIVSDIYLNPVNDSIMVYFSTEEGTMKSHQDRTKDLEGRAETFWMSNQIPATADGEVWIYAETAGGTVKDSSMFWSSGPPVTIWATGLPVTMPLDGKTEASFWIYALDINGHPVVAGTKYEFEAVYLKGSSGTFNDGCSSAWDRAKLTSAVLEQDYSMTGGTDDGIGAVENLMFFTGPGVTTLYSITLTTGVADQQKSSINGQTNAAWGETVNISVTIKDRSGNPLGDHTLTMTGVGGTVAGGTQTTNEIGVASGFRWTAPSVDGSFTIVITDTDPRGGIVLTRTIAVANN